MIKTMTINEMTVIMIMMQQIVEKMGRESSAWSARQKKSIVTNG